MVLINEASFEQLGHQTMDVPKAFDAVLRVVVPEAQFTVHGDPNGNVGHALFVYVLMAMLANRDDLDNRLDDFVEIAKWCTSDELPDFRYGHVGSFFIEPTETMIKLGVAKEGEPRLKFHDARWDGLDDEQRTQQMQRIYDRMGEAGAFDTPIIMTQLN